MPRSASSQLGRSARERRIRRVTGLKLLRSAADAPGVVAPRALPTQAGPVPDRISIWPMEDGRYGLDATFQGASGYERADRHCEALDGAGVRFSFRQELSDAWTLRFGPLTAQEVSHALTAFVR